MDDYIKQLVESLASKNKRLSLVHGSVMSVEGYGNTPSRDDVIRKLTTVMINIITGIKTEFVPKYNDLVSATKENINNSTPLSSLAKYYIRVIEMPSMMVDVENKLLTMTDPRQVIKLPVSLVGLASIDGKTEMFSFGKPSLDKGIQDIIDSYSEEHVVDIKKKYLTNISSTNPDIQKLVSSFDVTNLETILVVLSGVYGIINGADVNMRGSSLYIKEQLRIYKAYLENAIKRKIEIYKKYVEGEVLILGVKDEEIRVLAETYETYSISNDADIIIGYSINNPSVRNATLTEVLDNKTSSLSTIKSILTKDRINNIKNSEAIIINSINRAFLEIPEDELKYGHSVLNDIIKNSVNANNTIEESVLLVLSKVLRFEFNDHAYNFITAMIKYADNPVLNPDRDPKVAATAATIHVIAQYLYEQVIVSDVN